jgi:hypothetical protein
MDEEVVTELIQEDLKKKYPQGITKNIRAESPQTALQKYDVLEKN